VEGLLRGLVPGLALVVLVAASPDVDARPSPGLGVFAGAKILPGGKLDPSYDFGFFVDLPLINTFHLTPSAEVYRIGGDPTTDLALAFKFVVPMGRLKPYAAIAPGLTTFREHMDFHLAGAVGLYFHLVANLSLLAQVEYKRMMVEPDDVGDIDVGSGSLHGQAGLLFRF